MSDLVATLAAWVTSVVQTGGYPGIAFLSLLENLFLPIPSELILPVAGFLARRGQLEFFWVVVAATLGSLAGALVLYGLGYWLGESRLRALIQRHGRWLALEASDLPRARGWLERHGDQAVLFGRLIPSVRSVISIPAGLVQMPLLPFIGYTTLGSALWNSLLTAAGWFFGDHWGQVQPYLDLLDWAVLAALVVVLGWCLWHRRTGRDGRDKPNLEARS